MRKLKGWIFSSNSRSHLVPIHKDGETESWEGRLDLAQGGGYHAMASARDALECAKGSLLLRVEIWGDTPEECWGYAPRFGRIAGRYRLILWRMPAEELLGRFARKCALDVVQYWPAPIETVRFLKAKFYTQDEVDQAWIDANPYSKMWHHKERGARLASFHAADSCSRQVTHQEVEYNARYAASEALDAVAKNEADIYAHERAKKSQERRLSAMIGYGRKQKGISHG